MSTWIRLEVAYFGHLKTLRLRKLIGHLSDVYPLRLWAWAATYCPHGELQPGDIEMACQWDGKEGVLLQALIDTGFLDNDGKTLHGWMERSGGVLADIHQRRLDDAERKRDIRKTSKGHPKDVHDKTLDVQECPRVEERRGEEKRGEERREVDTCAEPPLAGRSAPEPASCPLDLSSLDLYAKTGNEPLWRAWPSLLAAWTAAYPRGRDWIMAEVRRAHAWEVANPAKRKTGRGRSRFLGSWLDRAQNSDHSAPARNKVLDQLASGEALAKKFEEQARGNR